MTSFSAIRRAWRDAYKRCNAYHDILGAAYSSKCEANIEVAEAHYAVLASERDVAYAAMHEAVTDEHIASLRKEAQEAGDYTLVDTCDLAADGWRAAQVTVANVLADAEDAVQ